MQIEDYFKQLNGLIAASLVVQLSRVTFDRRGTHEGFVRGELTYVDGSILHLREYVDVENEIERLMYVYQYMDARQALVFRYDNTGHHRDLNLSTYPHHKHDGAEDRIAPSHAPTLQEILAEIQRLVRLP